MCGRAPRAQICFLFYHYETLDGHRQLEKRLLFGQRGYSVNLGLHGGIRCGISRIRDFGEEGLEIG